MKKRCLSKEHIEDGIISLGLIVVTFIVAMQSQLDIFTSSGLAGKDSSVFRYIAGLMKEGYIPYRDTFDHKGPLLYVINYLGTCISELHGVWYLELFVIFASVLLSYHFARKFCNKIYSSFIVLVIFSLMNLFYDGGNFTEEYALPFMIISLYIFIDYFLNNYVTNFRVILCGVSFMCVFFLRANMIAVWLVFCILVLIQGIAEKRMKDIGKFLGLFVAGMLIVALPICGYLLYHHAFADFIDDYIIFNQMYASSSEFATIKDKVDALQFFGNNIPTVMAFIFMLSTLLKKEKRTFHIAYIIFMIVTMGSVAMSGQIFRHYGMPILPMLIYPLSLMCQRLQEEKDKKTGIQFVLVGYILFSVVLINWRIMTIYAVSDVVYVNNYQDKDLTDVAEYVKENSEETDTISVYGNRNLIYNLSQRKSASKYSYQTPIGRINPVIMDEYFSEIEERCPKFIILATDMDERLNTFLEQNSYMLTEENDSYQIYEIME